MRRKYLVGAIAVVALLIAAGTAGAASRWVISNINQIKPGVRQQLRGNAGPRGPQGPAGAAGVVPQIVTVESEQLTIQPGQDSFEVDPNNFQATCPAGYVVLGTGFNGPFNVVGGFVKSYGTLVGGFFENDSLIPLTAQVQAICGQAPGGETGSLRHHSTGSAETAYHAALRASQAKH
jgi:hypothetical protein